MFYVYVEKKKITQVAMLCMSGENKMSLELYTQDVFLKIILCDSPKSEKCLSEN